MEATTGLLKIVSSQNEHLVKSINEIKDRHTTDNQIAYYKNEQSLWFQNFNKMLLYFYSLLGLIFVYLIYKTKTVLTIKCLITFTVIVFPLIINKIEILLYNILKYIWTFILCIEYPYQQY